MFIISSLFVMNKKAYQKPAARVARIQHRLQMLNASPGPNASVQSSRQSYSFGDDDTWQ